MIKKIFDFDIEASMGFKKGKRNIAKNSKKFVEWIISSVKKECERDLQEGESYNALCISMNSKNTEYIREHIDPWVYLNYSPVEKDNIADDEYQIDLGSLIEADIK